MKNILLFLFFTTNFVYSQKTNYYNIFVENINNQFKIQKNIDYKNSALEFVENYSETFKNFEKSKDQKIQNIIQLIKNKDINAAIQSFEKNEIVNDNQIILARLYIINFQFVDAENLYEKIVNLDTTNIQNRIEQADFYFFSKMYNIAINLYKNILNQNLKKEIKTIIYYNISNSYLGFNDFKNALIFVNKAIENNSSDNFIQAKNLNLRGLIYTNLYTTKAVNDFENSLNKLKKLNKNNDKYNFQNAQTYFNLADYYYKTADNQNAINNFEICNNLCDNKNIQKYKLLQAKALYKISLNEIELNDYNQAIEYFDRTKEIYFSLTNIDSVEYLPYIADLQSKMGTIYTDLEQFDKAKDFFGQAETNFKIISEDFEFLAKIGMANLYNYEGLLNIKTLEYDLAYQNFTSSFYLFTELDQYASLEFKDEIASVYNNLGYLFELKNDYKKAFEFYNKSLNLREILTEITPKYNTQLVLTLTNIGNLYIENNENRSALNFLNKALNYYDSTTNSATEILNMAFIYNNIGILYNKTLMPDSAIFYYNKSIYFISKLELDNPKYLSQLSKTQYNMALAYFSNNDFKNSNLTILNAINNFNKLISNQNETYSIDLANCYNLLGDIFLYSDDFKLDSALQYYNLAYKIVLELNSKYNDLYYENLLISLQNLSNIYKYKRDYLNAIEYTIKLLQNYTILNEKNYNQYLDKIADTKSNLSILYDETKQEDTALENAKSALVIYRALAINNHEKYDADVAMAYNHLGNLNSEYSDFDKAIENYKMSINLRKILAEKKDINIIKVADTENNLALLYFELKQNDNAIQTFNDAIFIYETLAKKSENIENQLKLCMALINISIIYKNIILQNPNNEVIEIATNKISEALNILNKYPDNEQARTYMEYAVQLKGFFNTLDFQNN